MIAERMRFEKWQALGNDYLIVESDELPWALTPERIRRICDPHRGVGSDGILVLSPSEDAAYVAALRIFNPDGSEAELSGNGSRQAMIYLRRRGRVERDEFSILTPAGPISATISRAWTSNDTSLTAITPPNCFRACSICKSTPDAGVARGRAGSVSDG